MSRGAPLIAIGLVLAMTCLLPANAAFGYWSSSGAGVGIGSTGTLLAPTSVQVPATSDGTVGVSWTASAGTLAPTGYYVTRTIGSTVSAACGSGPTAPLTTTSCVDTVGDGSYTYLVIARYHSWAAASGISGTVAVAAPTQLAFRTNPTNSVVGAAIAPAVQVTVESADGSAVLSAGIAVTLTVGNNPAAGTLAGTSTMSTSADGIATFAGLSIDRVGVGYSLIAASTALTSATSSSFDIRKPPLAGPELGSAASYSVLGSAATGDGQTTLSGDLGTFPAATAAGFPDGTVQGITHTGDLTASAAETALTAAYADALSRPVDTEFAGDLNGVTFTAGVHHTAAALELSAAGTLALNGQGDPDSVFIFQVDGALNTGAGSSVLLVNGARASNVYWQVNGAAGTGALSSFSGTILASGAITIGAGGRLIGRALSSGAVTLANNTIRFTEALPPTVAIDAGSPETSSTAAPSISGTSTALSGQTVTIIISGQTLTTAVSSTGTWAVTGPPVPAGTYSVLARVRDAAGNAATATRLLTFQ
ncbi:MAG: hypothetical protein JWQ47_744 [Glaciihabitans sp.]|nr:hypothetical protein [Glaciihabitans sp.]